jgi:predicted Kef-type K+ transport protein
MPAYTLKARLAVGFARIFAGQQVTIKETRQRCQINAVLGNVRLALGFLVRDDCQIVDALCL